MTSKDTKEPNDEIEGISFWGNLTLSLQRIVINIDANARKILRSPSAIFFTVLYPVVFILILGSIFSGMEEPFTLELYVQNNDDGLVVGSETIHAWNDSLEPVITGLNNSAGEQFIQIRSVPAEDKKGQAIDAGKYLEQEDGYLCVVIPQNFTLKAYTNPPVNLTIILVEDSQFAQILNQILLKVIYNYNLELSGDTEKLEVISQDIFSGREISYAEYLIPGMIAVTFMNNALFVTISRYIDYRIANFFTKLLSSPMKKSDFVISEMLWQFILAIIAFFISFFTGVLAFNLSWNALHWMIFPIMLAGIMTFTGLGMIATGIVKTPNGATAVGNILSFPMIFLSGAFFDISGIPVLSIISKCLPLTYIIDALRASMISKNFSTAWLNMGVSLAFGIVFMVIGILLTKWTEEK
ncbi:MAG: hypothetical protein GF308_15805 [Candidatus Heimdallarchaeota archaeon]|nr:hypothetical protein [Candidatus Heimdallarchaeota archaeon]